jgi:Flp pilus assembly protein TadG
MSGSENETGGALLEAAIALPLLLLLAFGGIKYIMELQQFHAVSSVAHQTARFAALTISRSAIVEQFALQHDCASEPDESLTNSIEILEVALQGCQALRSIGTDASKYYVDIKTSLTPGIQARVYQAVKVEINSRDESGCVLNTFCSSGWSTFIIGRPI